MKTFAYGFNRKQKDFDGVKYDELFIEKNRRRPILAELIRDYLRAGHKDVIVVLDDADIPEQGPFREALKALGASIKVAGIDTPKRGAPVKFPQDEKTLAECRKIWNTPYFETYAAELISELIGRKVTRFTVKRHLGPRDFSRKD